MSLLLVASTHYKATSASMAVSQLGLGKSISIVTKSLLSQAAAWIKTPAGIATAVTAGITLVKWRLDQYQKIVETQKEIVNTATENIQKYEEEISSLETLQDKLNQSRGSKTALIDISSELNKVIGETPGLLEDEAGAYDVANAKITARIEELKKLREVEKGNKISAQKEIFRSNVSPYQLGVDDLSAVGLTIDVKEASEQLKRYEKERQAYLNFDGSEDSYAVKKVDSLIARYKEFLQQKTKEATDVFSDYIQEAFPDEVTRGYLTKYIEDLIFGGEDNLDTIDKKINDFSVKVKEFNELKDNFLKAKASGNDYSNEYNKLKSFIDDLSNVTPEAVKAAEAMKVGFESALNTPIEKAETFIDTLENLNKKLDSIQSAYQSLSNVIDEYNESGYISVDAFQEFLSLSPEMLQYFINEKGQLDLSKEALYSYTDALIDQATVKQMLSVIDYVSELNAEEQQAYLTSQATDSATESLQSYIETMLQAKLIEGSISVDTLPLLEKRLNAIAAMGEATKNGLRKGGFDKASADSAKKRLEAQEDYNKKVADINKDLEEKEKQHAEKMAEAWEKEYLERLKDDLNVHKDILDKYKSQIELFEFGTNILDENDYQGKLDLLNSKFDAATDYGRALRDEFERVSKIMPTTGAQASELASRIEELGSEMRDNVQLIRETGQQYNLLFATSLSDMTEDQINSLESNIKRLDRYIDILKSTDKDYGKYTKQLMYTDMFLPTESNKELRNRQKLDQKLIDLELTTQQTINQIVTDALEKQIQDNAKAREKERQQLIEDMEKTRVEAQQKLAEAKKDFDKKMKELSGSARNTIADIQNTFNNSDFKINVDSSQLDEAKQKIDEIGQKILDTQNNAFKIPGLTVGTGFMGANLGGFGSKYPAKPHDGGKAADFPAPSGTAIPAFQSGTVATIRSLTNSYGKHVVITDSNGQSYVYAHMSKFGDIEEGQKIQRGQTIGYVGSTGNSTGPHLHYGIKGYADGGIITERGTYMVGEEEYEIAVLPDGTFHIVGLNGIEMADFPKGTRIISHEEAKKIIDNKEDYTKKLEANNKLDVVGQNKYNLDATLTSMQNAQDEFNSSYQLEYANFMANKDGMSNDEQIAALDQLKSKQVEAMGEIGVEFAQEIANHFLKYMEDVKNGVVEYDSEIVQSYKDAYEKASEYAQQADEYIKEAKENRLNAYLDDADSYIDDMNFWDKEQDTIWKNGDSEVKARQRKLDKLRKDFPEAIEEIKQAEKDLEEAKRSEKERFISDLQDACNREIEIEQDKVDKIKKVNNLNISRYSSLLKLLDSFHNIQTSITDEQHNIAKELMASKAMAEYLDEDTRKLLFNDDDYKALSNTLEGIAKKASDLQAKYNRDILSATAENIDEITNGYERQYELLMQQYEVEKAKLEVAKKQQQLNNVLNERNVLMYIGGQGWTWVANTQDVINAQNELADAQYGVNKLDDGKANTNDEADYLKVKHNLEALSDTLQTENNELDKQMEDHRERLDKLVKRMEDEHQTVSDVLNSIAVNGGEYIHTVVNKCGSALENFYEKLTGDSLDYAYDPNIDYKAIMDTLPKGSYLWEYLNKLRNAKIDAQGLSYEKYASGTSSAKPGLGLTGEDGLEYIISPKYGKLIPIKTPTLMGYDGHEKVFSNEQVQKLWELSKGQIFDFQNMKGFNVTYPSPSASKSEIITHDNRIYLNGVEIKGDDGEALADAIRRIVRIS